MRYKSLQGTIKKSCHARQNQAMPEQPINNKKLLMPETQSTVLPKLKRAAAILEVAAIVIALLGLTYRATLFWLLPAGRGDAPGLAPLLDFGLAMLLFVVCVLCAGIGVAISLQGSQGDKRYAYQAFFIGVLSFLLYDLLHPYVPRLM